MAFGLKDRRSGAGRSVAHGKTGGHANLRTIGRKTGVPSDRPDRPAISRKINKRRKIQDSISGRPFIFSPLKSRSGTRSDGGRIRRMLRRPSFSKKIHRKYPLVFTIVLFVRFKKWRSNIYYLRR
ncbi:MAG: hypothetical protein C6P37_16685 [Caldibacillus debilis]|uniref:Uncharacterized protein n=1 Tax=Caldibacillus debilis TaxID=301148 RepID=A0A3E0JV68_9BACI|nr:MAG: hypothetical protein C6P37_16685 [Caldibacillus debilis]